MSYNTLAEANTYFSNRYGSSDWEDADVSDLQKALSTAYKRLNQEYYMGTRTSTSQEGAFPRYGLKDRNGEWIDENTVPQDIKDAECELALALLNGQYSLEVTGNTYDSITVGPLRLDYSESGDEPAGALPDLVIRLIGPFQQTRNRTVRA